MEAVEDNQVHLHVLVAHPGRLLTQLEPRCLVEEGVKLRVLCVHRADGLELGKVRLALHRLGEGRLVILEGRVRARAAGTGEENRGVGEDKAGGERRQTGPGEDKEEEIRIKTGIDNQR